MAEKTYKIYLLICLITHMGYVGQTRRERISQRTKGGKGYEKGTSIREAFDEYGSDNFACIILEDGLTSEQADEREKYWISFFNLTDPKIGYNRQLGGHLGMGSHYLTNEKISLSKKGKALSDETKKKLSESHKGKPGTMKGKHHTEETKKKLSEVHKGKKMSEETKKKMSESQKGKHNKAILQFTKDNQLISQFNSLSEAKAHTGISDSHISQCCHGLRKSAGESIWKLA